VEGLFSLIVIFFDMQLSMPSLSAVTEMLEFAGLASIGTIQDIGTVGSSLLRSEDSADTVSGSEKDSILVDCGNDSEVEESGKSNESPGGFHTHMDGTGEGGIEVVHVAYVTPMQDVADSKGPHCSVRSRFFSRAWKCTCVSIHERCRCCLKYLRSAYLIVSRT